MFSYRIWFFQSPKLSLVQHAVLLHRSAEPTCQFSIFDSDIGTHKFLKLTYSKCEFRVQDAALIWLLQLAVESLDSLINESVSQSSSLASAPGLSMEKTSVRQRVFYSESSSYEYGVGDPKNSKNILFRKPKGPPWLGSLNGALCNTVGKRRGPRGGIGSRVNMKTMSQAHWGPGLARLAATSSFKSNPSSIR